MLVNKLTRSGSDVQKDIWLAMNKGALTDVAHLCGVTRAMVSLVLRGRRKSSDGRIEAELNKRGAPGFQETTVSAQ